MDVGSRETERPESPAGSGAKGALQDWQPGGREKWADLGRWVGERAGRAEGLGVEGAEKEGFRLTRYFALSAGWVVVTG